MGDELVVDPAYQIRDWPHATGLVQHISAPIGTGDAQELDVGTGEVVQRVLPENEHSRHRGYGVVCRRDHLGGGEAFLGRAVVGREGFGVDGRRQVLVLETADLKVGEACARQGVSVEVTIAMTAPLTQHPLVLSRAERASGPTRTQVRPR